MHIRRPKEATTTPKVRALIQASDEPAWVLAERFGTTEQTVWKGRKREGVEDHCVRHTDVSFWAGERELNDCSIGIEIFSKHAFPLMQMKAVEVLCRSLLSRFPIPPKEF